MSMRTWWSSSLLWQFAQAVLCFMISLYHSAGNYGNNTNKVKRGNSDIGVQTQLHISYEAKNRHALTGLLTYTSTRNHRLTPQYAEDISANVGITPPWE